MHQVLHDYDLAEDPLGVDQVLNMRQLLDSDLLTCFAILCRYHRAISTLTDELNCFILDRQLKHYAFEVGAGEAGYVRLTGRAARCRLSGWWLLLSGLGPGWHLLLLLLQHEELILVRLVRLLTLFHH